MLIQPLFFSQCRTIQCDFASLSRKVNESIFLSTPCSNSASGRDEGTSFRLSAACSRCAIIRGLIGNSRKRAGNVRGCVSRTLTPVTSRWFSKERQIACFFFGASRACRVIPPVEMQIRRLFAQIAIGVSQVCRHVCLAVLRIGRTDESELSSSWVIVVIDNVRRNV